MDNQKEAQTNKNPPSKKGSKLLTFLCAALIVVGVGAIAYPFVLIGIENHNKNEVVAQLERELPIHRDESAFVPVDASFIASMPVVDVPIWTTEEVAAANAMLDGTQADLIALRPTPVPSAAPTRTASPTEAPQPGVHVLYEDEPASPVLADGSLLPDGQANQAALLPDTPTVVSPIAGSGSSMDPRQALQLRDAAPVYYEDFERIRQEADALNATLGEFVPEQNERTSFDSPTELTVASIKQQMQSMSGLLSYFRALPSTQEGTITFQSNDGERLVALAEGGAYLAEDIAALNNVVGQMEAMMRYPRAKALLQQGFDQSVRLADETLNVLDFLSQGLASEDVHAYLATRAASLVGETEAAYLLELPKLNLKVGCFPSMTFEQMYKSMRKGTALFPRVGTPNTNTNISMISHRTGSAAFFKDIDKIKIGDPVFLHTRGLGSFQYVVERLILTEEEDWTPMNAAGYPVLTLISCEEYQGVTHGKRIIARCKLVGIAR